MRRCTHSHLRWQECCCCQSAGLEQSTILLMTASDSSNDNWKRFCLASWLHLTNTLISLLVYLLRDDADGKMMATIVICVFIYSCWYFCSFLWIQGLLYAYSIRQLVTTTMNLHVSLQKPMTKASVLAMCRLIELLKAIEHTFHRRTAMLAESLHHIVQNVAHKTLSTFKTVRVRCR